MLTVCSYHHSRFTIHDSPLTLYRLGAVLVLAEKDEEENCEGHKRGASIAEEGQGDAYDRNKTQDHSYVDEYVHEENAGHRVAIESREP